MSNKMFTFNGRHREIQHPLNVSFENNFYKTVYQVLFDELVEGDISPSIDFDRFHDLSIGFDIYDLAIQHSVKLEKPSTVTDQNYKTNAMLAFFRQYPFFFNFLKNVTARADVCIKASEWKICATTNARNFITIKKDIDDQNKLRWTRDKTNSESQAGVSNLGNISENLLAAALNSFIDDTNFFKNNTSEVQSYGDFVLMCLPNNLWLSVKSNFARERLLASGYTTDIVGVGFFTDAGEFTSGSKIRNFQKVGFLAMYVPDIPVTDDQVANGTSTYSEIVSYYDGKEDELFPANINGKPFIRKLSEIGNDIGNLLSQNDIKRRTTIGY